MCSRLLGLEVCSMMLFGTNGWEEDDIRALLDKVKREVQDPALRGYAKV